MHVVAQDDRAALHRERDLRLLQDGRGRDRGEVVPVERDVEEPDGNAHALDALDLGREAPRERDSPRADADQDEAFGPAFGLDDLAGHAGDRPPLAGAVEQPELPVGSRGFAHERADYTTVSAASNAPLNIRRCPPFVLEPIRRHRRPPRARRRARAPASHARGARPLERREVALLALGAGSRRARARSSGALGSRLAVRALARARAPGDRGGPAPALEPVSGRRSSAARQLVSPRWVPRSSGPRSSSESDRAGTCLFSFAPSSRRPPRSSGSGIAGGRAPAAALGALAFAISSPFIAWLEHPQTLSAAAVPFLLLFGGRLAERPTRRDFAGLVVATFVVLSGGHPETALMAALLAAAYAAFRGGTLAALRWPAAGGLLGGALAAPLLLPFFEYYAHSAARLGEGRHPFVLPFVALRRFVLPDDPHSHPIEGAAAVSLAVLLLVPFGLRGVRRDSERRFWAVLGPGPSRNRLRRPARARSRGSHEPVSVARSALSAARSRLPRGRGSRRPHLPGGGRRTGSRGSRGRLVARGPRGARAARLRRPRPRRHAGARPDARHAAPRAAPRGGRDLSCSPAPHVSSGEHGDRPPARGSARLRRARSKGMARPAGGHRPLPRPAERARRRRALGSRAGGAALDAWSVKYLLLHPQFAFGAAELNARLGLDLVEVYSGPDGRILVNRRAKPRVRLEGAPGKRAPRRAHGDSLDDADGVPALCPGSSSRTRCSPAGGRESTGFLRASSRRPATSCRSPFPRAPTTSFWSTGRRPSGFPSRSRFSAQSSPSRRRVSLRSA